MGSVRLYGATSGYLELQAPDVSPDSVLTLPSTGFGKMLQIVRATDSTLRTTTSSSFVDASISVTITPQKADSVIILIWTALIGPYGSVQARGALRIADSSSNPISGAEAAYAGNESTTSSWDYLTVIGYDTPATTSATTYKGMHRAAVSGDTNRISNGSSTGSLYAIEVSA